MKAWPNPTGLIGLTLYVHYPIVVLYGLGRNSI